MSIFFQFLPFFAVVSQMSKMSKPVGVMKDDVYFDSYSDYSILAEMLQDKVRTEAYRDTICVNFIRSKKNQMPISLQAFEGELACRRMSTSNRPLKMINLCVTIGTVLSNKSPSIRLILAQSSEKLKLQVQMNRCP